MALAQVVCHRAGYLSESILNITISSPTASSYRCKGNGQQWCWAEREFELPDTGGELRGMLVVCQKSKSCEHGHKSKDDEQSQGCIVFT